MAARWIKEDIMSPLWRVPEDREGDSLSIVKCGGSVTTEDVTSPSWSVTGVEIKEDR